MSSSFNLVRQSTRILITRKIIQFEGEVYQFANVTGFSFSELDPTIIPIEKKSTLPWLLTLFLSVAYLLSSSMTVKGDVNPTPPASEVNLNQPKVSFVSRESKSSNSFQNEERIAAIIFLLFSVERILKIEFSESFRKEENYGLKLTLNSGESKIFISKNKPEILEVVEEIYKFMMLEDIEIGPGLGTLQRSISINYNYTNNIGTLSIDQSSSYYQYGQGDNVGRDKVEVK
jgi:hypothetical protein